jgi:glycosyltransferase involved in cell wall biosynthesis
MEFKQVDDGFFQVGIKARNLDDIKIHLEELHSRFPGSVWIVNHPNWTPRLADAIPDDCVLVYDCMDLWNAFPDSDSITDLWEMRIASVSDFVTASSMPLVNRMKLFNKRVAYVSNAVCVEDYRPFLKEASDLKDIPHPRIVFVGSIAEWVDLDLLVKMADFNQDWSVIVIGPSTKTDTRLPQRPNLHWFGKRPYYELSAYIAYCDVAVIPFKRNELTRAVNPLKVHEFLATGIPVVSTFLPDLLLLEGDDVKVGASHDEFIKAVSEILSQERDYENKLPVGNECTGTWGEKAKIIVELVRDSSALSSQAVGEINTRYVSVLRKMFERVPASDIFDQFLSASYGCQDFASILKVGPPGSILYACALVRTNKFEEARIWLSEYGARFDRTLPSLLKDLDDAGVLACILQLNGEFMESLTVLDNSFNQDGKTGNRLLAARAWYYLGFSEISLSIYDMLLNEMPETLKAKDYIIIGDIMREFGRFEDAENAYLQVANDSGFHEICVQKLRDLYFEKASNF